jgi:ribosomal protein L7Ae-like RNA K-turn-binding protein
LFLYVDMLDLVIVVRSVTPSMITQHLPVMLHAKGVPCIPLHCDCKELGLIFGMKTVVTFGLKVSDRFEYFLISDGFRKFPS